MPKKKHTELLNVFLVKKGIAEPRKIFKSVKTLEHYKISLGSNREGMLYVQKSRIQIPKWTRFFKAVLDPTKLGLKTASSAAILLVNIKERIIAVSFGHGRYLL